MSTKYDFGGYATRANYRCADGRTILPNAFADQDGAKVPLVWQHQRNNPDNVLGHALLENRDDGVYCYCTFNESPRAQQTKLLIEHGDVNSLSIYANNLTEKSKQVSHGIIREVSVVLAGANPGALIDNVVVQHSDGSFDEVDGEAVIYSGEEIESSIEHAAPAAVAQKAATGKEDEGSKSNSSVSDRSAKDIFDSMTEDQKALTYALFSFAMTAGEGDDDDDDSAKHSAEGGDSDMKYNVFEGSAEKKGPALSHDDISNIFDLAKKTGSLKGAAEDYLEQMNEENGLEHSVTQLDILFPEAKATRPTPEFLSREMDWVPKVWNATNKSPFSRIKSVYADITKDEARARGYIKGNKKVEEQFGLLKRVTSPQTIYKLQKMDRDDIIDITDFDVVAWIKGEMRTMLNEELARAVLIGDGRQPGDADKISADHIRPVLTDEDLYTIHHIIKGLPEDENEKGKQLIKEALKARKNYKGSGSPTYYGDVDTITTMLLVEDKNGRRIYNTMTELASALRVREIVEVPVMENCKRDGRSGVEAENGKKYQCLGLIVNLADYTIGADRGGAVSLFDDFDIDYNKYTYLIETRCSGGLRRPYSAISLEVELGE